MAPRVGRRPTARKAWLYLSQFFALAACTVQAALLLNSLIARKLGERVTSPDAWQVHFFSMAIGAAIALVLWAALRWVTVRDGDFGHEAGRSANWRRAYFYTVAFVGFVLLAAGTSGFLRAALGWVGQIMLGLPNTEVSSAPAAEVWRNPIAVPLTAIILGVPLTFLSWHKSNRLAAGAPAVELNALSRVAVLYAGILFGTIATLASLAVLLRQVLLFSLGQPIAAAAIYWENTLITPLACLPVGLVSWLVFSGIVRDDVARGGEGPKTAGVRRLTYYLVAAVALGLFWFGMTILLRLILLGAMGSLAAKELIGTQVQERFGMAGTFVLVGAPAWWGHWWSQQVRAREAGPEGHAERVSLVRRAYLYSVTVAAAVLVLAGLGVALYRALGPGTGGIAGSNLATLAAGSLATAAVALIWWVAHAVVLREDGRWLASEGATAKLEAAREERVPGPRSYSREELALLALSPEPASASRMVRSVVVIDGGDGSAGAALLARLRSVTPRASLWPVGLNARAQAAMLEALDGQVVVTVPPDALARATVVLGPSDVLVPGGLNGEVQVELASAIAVSPAHVLLLPPRDPRLTWVAAPDWPVERWLEYAVAEAAEWLIADG
jgi:hypothetical protein